MTTFCLYQLRKMGGKGEELEINICNAWWLVHLKKKQKEKKIEESSQESKQSKKNHHPPKGNSECFSKVANICPWGDAVLQTVTWHRLNLSRSLCIGYLQNYLSSCKHQLKVFIQISSVLLTSDHSETSLALGKINGTYSLKN